MPAWPELVAGLRVRLADVAPGQRIVACSGGLDSSVLMAALARLHAEEGWPAPRALHVNHGLHPDAASWAEATARRCRDLGAPCRVIEVAVERSDAGLEADARQARYGAFTEALDDGDVLLLAHHRDDQAETVLLRLLRGSGPAGLAGMPVRRRLGRGWLLRPLLDFDRSGLERAAGELGVVESFDPSNAELRQDRNFLRHEILPRLTDRWPGYRQTLSRAAELCREQEAALAVLLGPAPELMPVAALLGPPEVAAARLRHWLAAAGVAMPARSRLREILAQCHAREDAAVRIDLGDTSPGAVSVRRFAGALYIVDDNRPGPPGESLSWKPPGRLLLPHGALTATTVSASGLRQVESGYQVRFRQGGERLRPAGRSGARSLKGLLQEAAVPPWERGRLPLLYVGSELVAIADLYIAQGWQAGAGETGWRVAWQPERSALSG
ncbi:MAG: tRNA lysidine(34) synthetase TilS [Gammaproteobacteria bacterium]|nr:tRNA lysidine(34) synthetase TilS [Gammaproteobacteria bacterium]